MISVFDMFKIGIGPSSSHTVGPMKAGKQFVDQLISKGLISSITVITVEVYGSLSLTGKGHHTDIAIIMGLAGNMPDTVEIDSIPAFISDLELSQRLPLANGEHWVDFPRQGGMIFHNTNLPLHENGMKIHAFADSKKVYSKTYYSIGGGFIVDEEHFGKKEANTITVPYPFNSAEEILANCRQIGTSLSGVVKKNELAMHSETEIETYFTHIWQTMRTCINRGIKTEGILPGPLRVPRRAAALQRMLASSNKNSNDPMDVIDWVNMFALAVNEENAAGGRVVTAPTNGACGIIPAVLAYYDHFIESVTPEIFIRYFLASGAIGILYKMNASISGAEVGCQGEVGVACSMAAAGLAEILGASPVQVCIAAEIGMEHNLGLTCDPVAGQVQVPCIERNAIASVKAINSARMAIRRTSEPKVSLDKVIETMFATGKDMNAKYRETSRGGLAIKVQCS
ncbi:L-serine ammonia-lyase [Candidatus Fukatsuia symbiotica]|uniref:L-serine ammonia-lyase n=1 Tax=Candidatus Fukatsuia TaxID=1927833 RepID=UPI0009352A1B|nr:L-serine ammonia-lyase [Candidatus Fukatsuia symbiotica]MEA9444607.1 L-serine ammonia-lyase [Candidatus Fukatsuia symbiotica]